MNIFFSILIGLLVGGVVGWLTASSKAKLSFERGIREGKAKGAEASRGAVQRQAAIFQEEIVTLKTQVEKLQSERIQIEEAIKVSEARQLSHQQKIDEYVQKISLLEETIESLQAVNAEQKSQLSMAGERLSMAGDRLTFIQQKFEQSQEDISKFEVVLERIEKVPEILQAINQVTQKIEALKSDIETLPKQQALESISNKLDNLSEPKEIIKIKQALTNLQDNLDTKIDETFVKTKDLLGQIRPYKYSLIQIGDQRNDRAAIRARLIYALENSKKRLIMVCPWITTFAIDAEILNLMNDFLGRDKKNKIDIGWGSIRNIQTTRASQSAAGFRNQFWFNAISDLEQLQQNRPNQLNLKLMGTHEKFLVCDESWALITSHNFLTSGDNSDEREIGIVTNDEVLIRELIERYHNAPSL
jgi:hypothetical protein